MVNNYQRLFLYCHYPNIHALPTLRMFQSQSVALSGAYWSTCYQWNDSFKQLNANFFIRPTEPSCKVPHSKGWVTDINKWVSRLTAPYLAGKVTQQHVELNEFPMTSVRGTAIGRRKLARKHRNCSDIAICRLCMVVLSIFIQQGYPFRFCSEFDLFETQPCWFALHQWRAIWPMTYLYTSASHAGLFTDSDCQTRSGSVSRPWSPVFQASIYFIYLFILTD